MHLSRTYDLGETRRKLDVRARVNLLQVSDRRTLPPISTSNADDGSLRSGQGQVDDCTLSSSLARLVRGVTREAAVVEIVYSLTNLGFAIHHEWAVTDDGFSDWFAGQHQQLRISMCMDRYLTARAIEQKHLGFSDDMRAAYPKTAA